MDSTVWVKNRMGKYMIIAFCLAVSGMLMLAGCGGDGDDDDNGGPPAQTYEDPQYGDGAPTALEELIENDCSGNQIDVDPLIPDAFYVSGGTVNFQPDAGPCDSGEGMDPSSLDSFFDGSTFIGAIDPAGTDWTETDGWTISGDDRGAPDPNLAGLAWDTPNQTLTFTANGGTGKAEEDNAGGECWRLSGEFHENVDLGDGAFGTSPTFFLQGNVFIGDADGSAANNATITIPQGTVIYGLGGIPPGALVITRGSQIDAQGTSASPIVMTSPQASPARGDWGGLTLNGKASVNSDGSVPSYPEGEGATGPYGGTDDTDDSGTIQYVIVAYAGHLFTAEDEFNGIAFQGVGSGTTVDHIQVHKNADDGIEFFGGTCNVKYALLTGCGDDSIDWTYGWTGMGQYLIVHHYPDDADQGIEADNNKNYPDAPHRSHPILANVSLIGNISSSKSDIGMLFRRGTACGIYNSIIMGFNDAGIDIDGDETWMNAYDVTNFNDIEETSTLASPVQINVEKCIFFCNGDPNHYKDEGEDPQFGENDPTALEEFIENDCSGNQIDVDPIIPDAFYVSGGTVNFQPNTSGPCGSGGTDCSAIDSFFDGSTFIGAIDPAGTDWTETDGWTISGDDRGAPDPNLAGLAWDTPNQTLTFTANGGTGKAEEDNAGGECWRLSGEFHENVDLGDGAFGTSPTFFLQGNVFIGDADGSAANNATITIPQGTVIYGLGGIPPGALVITRGSQIDAQGTSASPIVMTSPQASPARGDWGGLTLNGKASVNSDGSVPSYPEGEGATGPYGGTDDTDDSGTIQYVIVAYAGHLFTAEDEFNGIAFQGVGSGTTVDHIQVHKNADDGIEFFGGTCNVKYALLTGCGDDSIDWTYGWTGMGQYLIVHHYPDDADQGIEADNNKNYPDAPHRSHPILANVSLIGNISSSKSDIGMLFRRGTACGIYNSIIMGFNDAGIDIDGDETWVNAYNESAFGDIDVSSTISGELTVQDCIFFCNGDPNHYKDE